jgi:N-acetyl-gamma-glutamyl-phosphate reductase
MKRDRQSVDVQVPPRRHDAPEHASIGVAKPRKLAPQKTPVLVLGGSGYVAGELLRLLASHPRLEVAQVTSTSRAGEPVEEVFPHLQGTFGGLELTPPELLPALLDGAGQLAIFSTLPHGESASPVDALLRKTEEAGVQPHVVDLSADFRFASRETYERIYGFPHPAPSRIEEFLCALPEHSVDAHPRHVAHPGCFTTAVVLACTPLLALDIVAPRFAVSAVTGSTGSGRTPKPTTHHPERASNLFAYSPLEHRHAPEMEELIAKAAGRRAELSFVPHSGPFSRGIHATIHADLKAPLSSGAVVAAVREFYSDSPFVHVAGEPPRLKDVIGTNRCRIGLHAKGTSLVAFAVIDNLVKGAAGGAIQWMNRLLGHEETMGLEAPAVGWI